VSDQASDNHNNSSGVDVVVPVHNSLHHARRCLESVVRASDVPYHLYVVDDGSDSHTAEQLREMQRRHGEHLTLLRNREPIGYLKSINQGIAEGHQPQVVLLNSDVVVAPKWLSRLLYPFEGDPSVGVINPVSNWANWTRIPFPPGATLRSGADFVWEAGVGHYADIYNASAFCFAVRRSLFDEIGLFDEAYSPGYWEETDFCMKALARGYRVVVNLRSFVYHFGWGSFQSEGRNEWLERNRQLFLERWGESFLELDQRWRVEKVLAPLERCIGARTRQMEHGRGGFSGLAHRVRTFGLGCALGASGKRMKELLTQSGIATDPGACFTRAWDRAITYPETGNPVKDERRWQDKSKRLIELASKPRCHRPGASRRPLRVMYLLPAVKLYGGIISVLQVVNSLTLRGEEANIVTYGEMDADMLRGFPLYVSPYRFPSRAVMFENFPECDILVATRWDTVYDALALQRTRPHMRLAYFVQDFEPDFYPPGSSLSRRAELTYHLIPNQIVKTEWLMRKLARFDAAITKIPIGLDLDVFYDREEEARSERIRLLAMARPTSKYRNYQGVLKIFAALHRRRPDLELCLYGANLNVASLPFPCQSHGPLYRMVDVAGLLNTCTILLDCSTFQGFGRPGLEAMATGTAAVLTRNGGITEYAKHRLNCLLADPLDIEENIERIVELVEDEGLRNSLVARGRETARRYDLRLEGERTQQFMQALVESS